jgi:hypothetical protein
MSSSASSPVGKRNRKQRKLPRRRRCQSLQSKFRRIAICSHRFAVGRIRPMCGPVAGPTGRAGSPLPAASGDSESGAHRVTRGTYRRPTGQWLELLTVQGGKAGPLPAASWDSQNGAHGVTRPTGQCFLMTPIFLRCVQHSRTIR